jgi:hypothetical protein
MFLLPDRAILPIRRDPAKLRGHAPAIRTTRVVVQKVQHGAPPADRNQRVSD